VVVDSFDEMDRIEALVGAGAAAPRVQIRVTPGVHVHTHAYVATGQDDSKFGFNLANGDARRAIERARASSAMDLVGLHCHIGSNVFDIDNFAEAATVMVELATESGLPELTLGGGLGVAYVASENAPTITQWAEALRPVISRLPSSVRVLVEPGRSIVAGAAVTVYRIGTIKEIPGVRTYAAVDGGMSDNPRPMLYGSGYETFDPMRVAADRDKVVRLVGKHCESGDVLVEEARVPADIAVGDLVATPVTGAYGHSMGSTYQKVTRPPVVFVADGSARLVVRRETFEDLLRLDL
jgi:diaminopimelate decarboxylase